MGCSGVRYDDERRPWDDAMARWECLVDATEERARRRDLFAAAALAGALACPNTSDDRRRRAFGGYEAFADEAVRHADALLAALDAPAGPTSVCVPPAPVTRPGETERP